MLLRSLPASILLPRLPQAVALGLFLAPQILAAAPLPSGAWATSLVQGHNPTPSEFYERGRDLSSRIMARMVSRMVEAPLESRPFYEKLLTFLELVDKERSSLDQPMRAGDARLRWKIHAAVMKTYHQWLDSVLYFLEHGSDPSLYPLPSPRLVLRIAPVLRDNLPENHDLNGVMTRFLGFLEQTGFLLALCQIDQAHLEDEVGRSLRELRKGLANPDSKAFPAGTIPLEQIFSRLNQRAKATSAKLVENLPQGRQLPGSTLRLREFLDASSEAEIQARDKALETWPEEDLSLFGWAWKYRLSESPPSQPPPASPPPRPTPGPSPEATKPPPPTPTPPAEPPSKPSQDQLPSKPSSSPSPFGLLELVLGASILGLGGLLLHFRKRDQRPTPFPGAPAVQPTASAAPNQATRMLSAPAPGSFPDADLEDSEGPEPSSGVLRNSSLSRPPIDLGQGPEASDPAPPASSPLPAPAQADDEIVILESFPPRAPQSEAASEKIQISDEGEVSVLIEDEDEDEELHEETEDDPDSEEFPGDSSAGSPQPGPSALKSEDDGDLTHSDAGSEAIQLSPTSWIETLLRQALGERYQFSELLGSGGMGTVVQCFDRRLERSVAIKVPPPNLAMDKRFRIRFLREAKALAKLEHENVGRVYDVPDIPKGATPVIVMEFLDGENLVALHEQRGRFSRKEVFDWVCQAAAGLAHAHSRSVLHRDIKPSNLMLVNGRIKIIDFGLARVDDGSSLTRAGAVIGSVPYMPPEQLRGEPVDERADLYSLAATGYALFTGRLPFAKTDVERRVIPKLSVNREGIPPIFDVIFAKALAPEKDQRTRSVAEFREALLRGGRAVNRRRQVRGPQG